MSEPVIIAVITNVTTIIVVILSRLWSRSEHKKTGKDVNTIKNELNGENL